MKYVLRLFSLLTVLTASILFFTNSAQAATLNVVAGTDGIEENSQCQLSEAIQNINDQAQTNLDCPAGDGNNDTINLPVGTITAENIPQFRNSVKLIGPAEKTIFDGEPRFTNFDDVIDIEMRNMKLTDVDYQGIVFQKGNFTLDNIEIVGNGQDNDLEFMYGIFLGNDVENGTSNISLNNIVIRDFNEANTNFFHLFVITNMEANTTTNVEANNIVISNIIGDFDFNNLIFNVGAYGRGSGTMNVEVNNLTIDTVRAMNGAVALINASPTIVEGEVSAEVNLNITNSTISHGSSTEGVYGGGGGIAAAGFAMPENSTAIASVALKNVIVADQINQGSGRGCWSEDVGGILGGSQGAVEASITSLGGNLSDDASCNSAFTHPADQTEVAGLADTLGPLSDNGGSIPTIPLLPGSPAIDAGVTVPGLTTDARGVSRPQCAAFDSGAYEYNGTCPAPGGGSDPDPIPDAVEDAAPNNGDGNGDGTPDSEQANVTSLPIPSGSNAGTYVTLVTPAGTTLTATTIQQATTLATQDAVYDYPLGLVSFTVADVTPGATIPVTLYFTTTQSPDNFTPRKYKPSTQAFFDIPGATLTTEQVGSTPTLKLTYNITDGGDLDDDQTANGTIVDPVGLATRAGLAATGDNLYLYLAGIISLVGAGVWVSRRAKAL